MKQLINVRDDFDRQVRENRDKTYTLRDAIADKMYELNGWR